MELVSIVILMCIGNAAGWLTFIYVEHGRGGLIQGVVLGVLGALVGGILAASALPRFGIVSAMVGGTFGSVFLILLARSRLARGPRRE